MSDTSVISILASVGILLGGTVTADAAAFASAIKSGAPNQLVEFVRENPESQFAPDAILLAAILSQSRLEDSAATTDGGLSCKLWVEIIDGDNAIVHWESNGATALGLFPALGDEAPGATGQVKVAIDSVRLLTFVAADAAGNQIKCSVNVVPETPTYNDPLPSGGGPVTVSIA